MQQFGHLPRRGEHTTLGGWRFVILNADTRRIRLLEAYRDHRRDDEESDEQEDPNA
jgi:magnesium and cobalt transporter